jgi:hypothetical protein
MKPAAPSDEQSAAAGASLDQEKARPRGLPPPGLLPPVAEPSRLTRSAASRPSEAALGGQSLWDEDGSEWRYYPEDRWHNPHWDYNDHATPGAPWCNVPIGDKPPVKA